MDGPKHCDHCQEDNERLTQALADIEHHANWVKRRNEWSRLLVTVGQPPNPDQACREIVQIARRALGAM